MVEPVFVEERPKADDEIVPVVESDDEKPEEKAEDTTAEEVEEYIDYEAEKEEWKDKYDYTKGDKRGEIDRLIEEANEKSSSYINLFDLNESDARGHYLKFLNGSKDEIKQNINNLELEIKNEKDSVKITFLKKSLEKLDRELKYVIKLTSDIYRNEQLFISRYDTDTDSKKSLGNTRNLNTSDIEEAQIVEEGQLYGEEPEIPSEPEKVIIAGELESKETVRKVFAKRPDNLSFTESNFIETQDGESLYAIEIDGDKGKVAFSGNEGAVKTGLTDIEYYFSGFEMKNRPTLEKRKVKIIEDGTIEKQGSNWVITKQPVIEFISDTEGTNVENEDTIEVVEKYPRSKSFKNELEILEKRVAKKEYAVSGWNSFNPDLVILDDNGNILKYGKRDEGGNWVEKTEKIEKEKESEVRAKYFADKEKIEIFKSPLIEKIMELIYKTNQLNKREDGESDLADWLMRKGYKETDLGASFFIDLKYSNVGEWLFNSKDKLGSIEKIINEELQEVNVKLDSSTTVEKVNPIEEAEKIIQEEKEKIEARIRSGEYIINKENKRVARFDQEGNLTDYGRYEGEDAFNEKWVSQMEYEQTLSNSKQLKREKEEEMKELLEADKEQLELIDSSLVKNILELGRRLGGMDKLVDLFRKRSDEGVYQLEDLGVYTNLDNNDILRYINYNIENMRIKKETMEAVFEKELALLENKE